MPLKQLHSISSKSSTQMVGKALGLIVSLGVLGIHIEEAKAQIYLDNPTAKFGIANTLAGYSVTVGSTRLGRFGPLPAGTTVELQYKNPAGVNIGLPLTATIGAGGKLNIPPPPIPAGAAGLGNKVTITDTLTGDVSKPLKWYDSGWFWWEVPAIKIDPLGIPGLTTNQSWFIDGTPEIIGTSSEFGTVPTTVIDSNFDLQYTDLGSGLFEAKVVGDNSFIKLANNTYVSFSDGSSFGNIQIDFNDGATANGTFNFSAIGLTGSWDWDVISDYTEGTGTPIFGGFNAPAISASTIPEPTSTLSLLSLGILGTGATLKRKLKGTNSLEKDPTKVG